MLVINCKNYPEVSTIPKLRKLISAVGRVASEHRIPICVAPPQHLLAVAAEDIRARSDARLVVLAQHVDVRNVGSTTGYVVPDLLKESGVGGSIINHSEHRLEPSDIRIIVGRLRELGMMSVLCVQDVSEAGRYAGMNPDYIAIEPPELIGSGRAVSTERPELVSDAAKAVSESSSTSKLLCGAGIISGADAARARELGSVGILVASGVVRKDSSDWSGAIEDLARPLAG